MFLTFEEFLAIDFKHAEGENFAIINDVLSHLTGNKFFTKRSKSTAATRRREEKGVQFPSAGQDEELSNIKDGIPIPVFNSIFRAFKKLWGSGIYICPDSDVDGIAVLTERNFTQNLKFVLGVEDEFFGKLLYLYFAKGFDQAKITLAKFIEGLKPYLSEDDKQKHCQASFNILDIDRDGQLNVLNLLYLFGNLRRNSKLGAELFRVIEFFLERNLFDKSTKKCPINLDLYLKLNNYKMCMNEEIRLRFLGIIDGRTMGHLNIQKIG